MTRESCDAWARLPCSAAVKDRRRPPCGRGRGFAPVLDGANGGLSYEQQACHSQVLFLGALEENASADSQRPLQCVALGDESCILPSMAIRFGFSIEGAFQEGCVFSDETAFRCF